MTFNAQSLPKAIWWLIWLALVSAIIIYVAILHFTGTPSGPDGAWRDLRDPLLIAGLVVAIGSLGIRFGVTTRLIGAKKLQAAFSAFIVSLALAEAPAIFGLVLGFQGAPPAVYLPFFAASFLTMLLQAPTFLNSVHETDRN